MISCVTERRFGLSGATLALAEYLAGQRRLKYSGINDAVKGVDVASAEYLLAMKLFSSRAETDAEDLALLYPEVGMPGGVEPE
jgi:hypothetical protein